MPLTTSVQTCSECAAELPANAPEGLCPRCLAAMGIGLALASEQPSPGLGLDVKDQTPEVGGQPPLRRSAAPGAKHGASGPLARLQGGNSEIRNQTAEIQNPRLRYFGDYQLIEEIARGGMGVVYRARQLSLNRIVAVKMLLFGKFSSDEYVRRFRAEAAAAAALQHPNIVAIHEIGQHEGQYYFSMDYVAGKNLAEVVRDGPLPYKRIARHLQTIAEAVQYAHEHGVLHRDLKPSNVLIDSLDQPRITDFGLAKQLKGDSELTATGHMLGSPSFMP